MLVAHSLAHTVISRSLSDEFGDRADVCSWLVLPSVCLSFSVALDSSHMCQETDIPTETRKHAEIKNVPTCTSCVTVATADSVL